MKEYTVNSGYGWHAWFWVDKEEFEGEWKIGNKQNSLILLTPTKRAGWITGLPQIAGMPCRYQTISLTPFQQMSCFPFVLTILICPTYYFMITCKKDWKISKISSMALKHYYNAMMLLKYSWQQTVPSFLDLKHEALCPYKKKGIAL